MAPSKPTWQLNEELHRLRVQLNDCESFFDKLWADRNISKLFRSDLAKIRCELCGIYDCSVRNDPDECLREIILPERYGPPQRLPVVNKVEGAP